MSEQHDRGDGQPELNLRFFDGWVNPPLFDDDSDDDDGSDDGDDNSNDNN
jgi:hypothetical protein